MTYLGGFVGRGETLQLMSLGHQMFSRCDVEPFPNDNATQNSADLFPARAGSGTRLGQTFPDGNKSLPIHTRRYSGGSQLL